MATLYQLSDELRVYLDAIDECEDDEAIRELMDKACSIGESISGKGEAYIKVMRNLQTDIDAVKAEKARLDAMQKRREKAVERLKENILAAMNVAELNRIETPLGIWSRRTAPWSVEIEDETKVDARFLIPQPPKIDKKAILDEFKKTGEVLPGCEFSQRDYVAFR